LIPSQQTLKPPFVVCITGASRGIGAKTAKAFAEAGATGLILAARTESGLHRTQDACKAVAKSANLMISTVVSAVGTKEAAEHIARVINNEHGRLDVLVNNAGILSTKESAFAATLEDMDDDQFEIPIQVNYFGRIHMIKHLMPLLRNSSDGARTVVNVSSITGHLTQGTPFGFNISELATNRLTEIMAEMYAQDGIVFHAVHPGMVKHTVFPPGMPEDFKQFCQDDMSLCGAFLIWLVKQRREWLSGRYISATWDVEELEAKKDEIVEGDRLKMRMVV
jgi:NAD(P)-dependent dehydrogenase (short-subunit alcohol dehydrogenase family)